MHTLEKRRTSAILIVTLGLFVSTLAACGGGGGGSNGAGRGLALLSFEQNSIDNVALNTRLSLEFSEAVRPDTITNASVQIREGSQFGRTVPGQFVIDGSRVMFEPTLASRCDHSDSGLKPDTQYRVQLVGFPEEFAIRNTAGQPLNTTSTYEFHTRLDTDPALYLDGMPGSGPSVLSTSPAHGAAAVPVVAGNRLEIELSENVDPCSVNTNSVKVYMYESGDPSFANSVVAPNGKRSGFYKGSDVTDQLPLDPLRWGADVSTSYAAAPRRILCNLMLVQDFTSCKLLVTPLDGYSANPLRNESRFPENALIVVVLDFNIKDYGGLPMTPATIAFTTENLASSSGAHLIANDGETGYDEAKTTAVVNPDPRATSRVQGYMLFSGDGDNGSNPLRPSLPGNVSTGCVGDIQPNDGTLDEFDAQTDVLLDTGAVINTCLNATDGSTAVVWEFNSFRIRNGATVRVVGVNPAIILVQGDAVIEAGGRLLVRGDASGGAPQGRGANGYAWTSYATAVVKGGTGVAGGGGGGDSTKFEGGQAGQDAFSGYGSPDGQATKGGAGAGQGGSAHDTTYPSSPGTAQGGGGGGHALAGGTATNVIGAGHTNLGPTRGKGGTFYPTTPGAERMPKPSAGSGGGAGGNEEWDGSYDGIYSTGGAAGGAGGGFVDLTSSGNILVFGTIDAAGSSGGDGTQSAYYAGPGGGGGGSGGGIRLLTPNDIVLGATALVTTAGGGGGNSPNGNSGTGGPQNHGAAGANGRIVMEDSDSVIAGLSAANVVPGEGKPGFIRSVFDPGRFRGGGLSPQALSVLIPIGNYAGYNPVYQAPIPADFKVGIPSTGTVGPGKTAILIEARGYQMKADGSADLATATGWVSIGYFRDTGVENAPTWAAGHPGDVTVAPDATGGGGGFTELNALGGGGHELLQLRFTMFLPVTVGPFDPGPYIDDWTIRFTHDQ